MMRWPWQLANVSTWLPLQDVGFDGFDDESNCNMVTGMPIARIGSLGGLNGDIYGYLILITMASGGDFSNRLCFSWWGL